MILLHFLLPPTNFPKNPYEVKSQKTQKPNKKSPKQNQKNTKLPP